MNKFNALIFALASLTVVSCSGAGESSKRNAKSAEAAIEYEFYAKDVNTGDDTIKLYASRMNQIADALEKVANKADAEYAAKLILDSAHEYELMETRLDELGRSNMARTLANDPSDYADAQTDRYVKAQTRMMAAMQKVAEKDPQLLIKISMAMQKMQKSEAL